MPLRLVDPWPQLSGPVDPWPQTRATPVHGTVGACGPLASSIGACGPLASFQQPLTVVWCAAPAGTRHASGHGYPRACAGLGSCHGGVRHDRGGPAPPPPGVSITKVSPAASLTESHPRIAVTEPSARSTQCRPSAPGPPPAMPNAGTLRWPASVVTIIGSRNLIRRTPPSPPRQRPLPPLPLRIAYDSSRTG